MKLHSLGVRDSWNINHPFTGQTSRATVPYILAHGGFHRTDFFLLVTPDKLYLWKEAGTEPAVVQPAFEVDAQPILKPYFERAGVSPADVSGRAFELVVAAWLGDLIRLAEDPENLCNGQRWLVETGLLGAVENGRIEYEVAT